jgi:hypothetical protein
MEKEEPMQIVANEKHIASRKKIGERAPFAGLIFLAGSTVLIFLKPEWIWATMALVWVGFLVSLMGSYLGERYVGPNAHHKRVPEALKGMDNTYTLLMYQLPAPFVLVEPGGLTVITVRSQGGQIVYDEAGRWRQKQKLGILRRFAGQESLGRPHRLAEMELEEVVKALKKALPEGIEVPVRSVLLFTAPNVELQVVEEAVPLPALRSAGLKRWLRRNPMKPQLVGETQAALQEALGLA